MGKRTTFTTALEQISALKALDQTTLFLDSKDADLPWDHVIAVEIGSLWRLSGPASCWIVAEKDGLTFKWSVDFEESDANGRGVSMFDRATLRKVIVRLPPKARKSFAKMLETSVLPKLSERTKEVREALNRQLDSEDCVNGLIEFARQS